MYFFISCSMCTCVYERKCTCYRSAFFVEDHSRYWLLQPKIQILDEKSKIHLFWVKTLLRIGLYCWETILKGRKYSRKYDKYIRMHTQVSVMRCACIFYAEDSHRICSKYLTSCCHSGALSGHANHTAPVHHQHPHAVQNKGMCTCSAHTELAISCRIRTKCFNVLYSNMPHGSKCCIAEIGGFVIFLNFLFRWILIRRIGEPWSYCGRGRVPVAA